MDCHPDGVTMSAVYNNYPGRNTIYDNFSKNPDIEGLFY